MSAPARRPTPAPEPRRPLPASDGLLPDFDDSRNLIVWAEARTSIAFAAGLAEAEANPMRREKP